MEGGGTGARGAGEKSQKVEVAGACRVMVGWVEYRCGDSVIGVLHK